MIKKFYDKWFYLITFIPLWVLILGNFFNRSLFSHHSLQKGFVEDYPALWLMAVGLIINWTLLRKYRHLIISGDLDYVYQNKIKTFLLQLFASLGSLLVNHQWVLIQLNNNKTEWFSYKGHIPYLFSKTTENFNVIGLIYYLISLFFWILLLMLLFHLIASMFLYAKKVKKREMITLSKSSYFYYSSAIVFSVLFFYLSLQINDILLEGFDTFSLHPNRLLLLGFSVILLSVYTVITTLVKFHPTNDDILSKSIFRRETSLDLLIIFVPFFIVTSYTIFIQKYMTQDSYFTKASMSFIVLILIIIIVGFNQYFKVKRLETLKQVIVENNTLTSYTHTVESLYHEMRHYKHDFNNILLSFGTYFEQEDYEGLTNYYNSELLKLTHTINPHFELVNMLTMLEQVPLKGLIISKLGHLPSLGIKVNLQIRDFKTHMADLDLCRAIGILLDNAAEACSDSDDKVIVLSLIESEIVVGNSYNGDLNLDLIHNFGYSTKGSTRGIGLHSLDNLMKTYPDLLLKTSISDQLFLQKITNR